jgi:hypothetical protein
MAVDLLPELGLPAIEYKTVLNFALQAAQTIGMDGNDPDLTEGPDGHPFPTNLETAARDEVIRAARLCSQNHVLQDKLQQKKEQAAKELTMYAECQQEQAAKAANKKREMIQMIAGVKQEQAAKFLTMHAECKPNASKSRQLRRRIRSGSQLRSKLELRSRRRSGRQEEQEGEQQGGEARVGRAWHAPS